MPSEKKEFLAFKFKVEKAEDDGTTGFIKGMASTFGNVDLGYDVIQKGAFKKTIKEKNGIFPMLLDHDPTVPGGYSRQTQETEKGLSFDSEFKLYDPRVKQRYELAKLSLELNSPMGVSIGYSAIQYEFQKQDGDAQGPTVRLLKEIKLYEMSLVTFPMNEMAGVNGAKAAWAGLFDRLQNAGYDPIKLEKALAALGLEPEPSPAATQEIDPELLQSMDKLIRTMQTA